MNRSTASQVCSGSTTSTSTSTSTTLYLHNSTNCANTEYGIVLYEHIANLLLV